MNIDQELLNEYVEKSALDSLNKLKNEVEAKIDDYVGEFKGYLNQVAAEFEKGQYAEEFQKESDVIVNDLNDTIKQLSEINEIAKALSKKGPNTLTEEVDKLRTATANLQQRLDETRGKAQVFGNLSGKFVAGALKKVITSGLPGI